MSPRIKTKPETFENADEFRDAINTIAKLQLKMRELQLRRDKALQRIQERTEPQIKDADEEVKRLVKKAERFADAHRCEIFTGDARTAHTELANYGFRYGTPKLKQLKGWAADKIVEAIQAKGWAKRFLNTSPTIRKAEIKNQLDNEQLQEIGYSLVRDEAFWVEAKAKEEN